LTRSRQLEEMGRVPKAEVGLLLSNLKTTLSSILSGLRDFADSDEQILEICSWLQTISAQLTNLSRVYSAESGNPAIARRQIEAYCEILTNSRHQFTYCSPKMHQLMMKVERAARRDIPILLEGETGVGKELVARFIHISSGRNRGPFVPVNCAAIPKELFENQFFGHRQGAFTGASRDHAGIIRSASGGTLFLDEVGEMPLDLQPKLLRFLQEGEVHPIGDSAPSPVDVRVIASTNRDLASEVRAGRFRADLLHRLNIMSFEIPPLRGRQEDIPLLLNFFLDKCCGLPGNHRVEFAPDALDRLMAYSWPGNVRELSSLVLQIVSLAEEEMIVFPSDLPEEIARQGILPVDEPGLVPYEPVPVGRRLDSSSASTLGEAVAVLERKKVHEALVTNDWNYSRAARQLGLSTYGLRKKYRRLFGDGPALSAIE
jgi:hydrogenase-4 transcriptional activator